MPHPTLVTAHVHHPPSCTHIHLHARTETSHYGRDSNPSRYTSSSHHHQPWHQMAQAYTWVDEHDRFVRREKQNTKTEQWVLEQRVYLNQVHPQPAFSRAQREKAWEDVVYTCEIKADKWTSREEEVRQRVIRREMERTKIIQDEIRRTEERIRMKREAERQKIAEERAKTYLEKRERERRERMRVGKAVQEAWTSYETRWAAMQASSDTLTFSSIPWPLLAAPSRPERMSAADITSFLLSPLHSQAQTRKERIRSAQLRWHPDRFRRFMNRVSESEKAKVEAGVGIVARCLNDL